MERLLDVLREQLHLTGTKEGCGEGERATRLADAMQARGFDIRAVRPPTVPEGSARLRLSLTLNVDNETVTARAAALAEELERLGP